jgi:hypothetical protein
MPQATAESLDERFWRRVVAGSEDECWTWTGAHLTDGTPVFNFCRRDSQQIDLRSRFGTNSTTAIPAARLMWALTIGDVPYNRIVFHTCFNRECVNPNHLELGTMQDNANLKVANDRQPFGPRNGKAKLTPQTAAQIYETYFSDNDTSLSDVARMFGISQSTVANICSGHIWAHATAATPTFKWRKRLTSSDQHDRAWFNRNHDPRWRD